MIVDASVWLSALLVDEVRHEVTRRWLDLQLMNPTDLAAPTLLLAEVAGVMSRRTGIASLGDQAASSILGAAGLRLIALDVDLGTEAARIAASLRLRGADAVYVAVARSLQEPLVSWDNELLARARGFIEVSQPLV